MRRPLVAVAAAALLAVVVVAVAVAGLRSGAAATAPAAGPPIVLAAASLTEVLPRIAPEARASFGGSNQLAQQIRQGAPFDVFLSASPRYTRDLHAEGLVRKPVAFATNSLVVVVPRGNPARIRSVADLARRKELRLVVAGPQVPIGLYTREVLKRLGLLRVLRKAVSLEPDVKGIVGKVALGEADAGFVYASDVTPVEGRVRQIAIPARAQPTVRYELAVATDPVDLEAAQELVIAILGPAGRRALRQAGFGET
jgi:molybdate transport system substrate-binding protein